MQSAVEAHLALRDLQRLRAGLDAGKSARSLGLSPEDGAQIRDLFLLTAKPMLYVRKKPKGFGRGAQIEGQMKDGARVLLVEDLTTDGGSKIAFANALRSAGAVVEDVFSIFYYNIYDNSAAALR